VKEEKKEKRIFSHPSPRKERKEGRGMKKGMTSSSYGRKKKKGKSLL